MLKTTNTRPRTSRPKQKDTDPRDALVITVQNLLQADLDAKGMEGSILRPDDDRLNELFTYHQKVLKRNVRRAVSLSPSESKPSFWFADLIGSIVSGFAMFLAVLSILLAQVPSAFPRPRPWPPAPTSHAECKELANQKTLRSLRSMSFDQIPRFTNDDAV